MSDPARPDEIRRTSFGQARRGYDKEEVDRFRDQVAGEIEALLGRIAEFESGGRALGLEDAASLRAELETVSEDVAEILAVAQEAAEGLRSRAAADAVTWRADADRESREVRRGAQRDAEQARGDAWETAGDLLEQAKSTAKAMLDAAAEDALFVRAEAEREALRHTGDARRDREEIVREARLEADRTLDVARIESEQILEAARVSADAAQERARALERRRGELMEELEAARLSIGQLEHEIDTRREALATAAGSTDSGVRVVGPGGGYDWQDDESSVRVLPGNVMPADEPVDADSLVAEVEALQRAIEAVGSDDVRDDVRDDELPSRQDTGDVDRAGGVESAAIPRPESVPELEPEAVVEREPEAVVEREPEAVVEPEREPEPESVVEGEPEAVVEPEREPEPEAVVEWEPEAEVEPQRGPANDLDRLFARLRAPEPQRPARLQPEPEPEPATATEVLDAAPDAVPESPPEPAARVREPSEDGAAVAAGAFDLRERLLLPIENRALRSVKRRIVDLQNRILEELRVGGDDWMPDRALLAAAIGDEMATVVAESHVAGYAAAAELTGSTSTPHLERAPERDDTSPFIDAFGHAVVDALERSRAAGGGARQVSAAVGRVFRAWRTDEVERRLRNAARTSYHEGVIGGLAALGVEQVRAVAQGGHTCGRCPAASGATWRPGAGLPSGTSMPPAAADCTATIVPVMG